MDYLVTIGKTSCNMKINTEQRLVVMSKGALSNDLQKNEIKSLTIWLTKWNKILRKESFLSLLWNYN